MPKTLVLTRRDGGRRRKGGEGWSAGPHIPTQVKTVFQSSHCVNTTQTIFWGERLFVWNEDHHQVRSIVFHPHRSLPDFPHPALADSQKPASYCCAMQVLSPASNCPPLVEVEDLYMVIIVNTVSSSAEPDVNPSRMSPSLWRLKLELSYNQWVSNEL